MLTRLSTLGTVYLYVECEFPVCILFLLHMYRHLSSRSCQYCLCQCKAIHVNCSWHENWWANINLIHFCKKLFNLFSTFGVLYLLRMSSTSSSTFSHCHHHCRQSFAICYFRCSSKQCFKTQSVISQPWSCWNSSPGWSMPWCG